jgi:hypothetical protein
MIGEVPGGKPGAATRKHLFDGAPRVDRAVGARDLPHSIQDAADVEIGGELQATRRRQCHLRHRFLTRLEYTHTRARILQGQTIGTRGLRAAHFRLLCFSHVQVAKPHHMSSGKLRLWNERRSDASLAFGRTALKSCRSNLAQKKCVADNLDYRHIFKIDFRIIDGRRVKHMEQFGHVRPIFDGRK